MGKRIYVFPKKAELGSAMAVLKPEKPQESSIVIFGAGAVGFAALFAAAAIGIRTIVVIDLLDSRLELAKTLGATHTIPGKASDILEQISKITDGGADYSIDATGAAPCIKNAWEVRDEPHYRRNKSEYQSVVPRPIRQDGAARNAWTRANGQPRHSRCGLPE